jgi:ABC-type nitrate/sulfonate/bicarbonate transport system substrate-binding protein
MKTTATLETASSRPIGISLWLLIASSLLIMTGCSKPQQELSLRFADPSQPMITLMYVAEEKGFFEKQGLKIIYDPVTSGRDSINKLLAGEVDLGAATEFPLAKNIYEGRDIQIVSTLFRTNHYSGMVARRDHGITSVKDLVGKKIGLVPNTNSDYLLSMMLSLEALSDKDVTRMPFKPEQLAPALKAAQVDAIVAWSPHLQNASSLLEPDNRVILRTPLYTEMSVIAVRGDKAEQHKQALERLARALVEAEEFIAGHSDETFELVIQRLKMGDKALRDLQESWPYFRHQARLDNLLLTSLKNEAEWLASGDKENRPVPKFKTRVLHEPLSAAKASAVTLDLN